MILFLIGLPGSGKSTLGLALAKELSYQFRDLDSIIEEEQGTTIAELFQNKGETEFRSIERIALKNCKNLKDSVIAAGGGTPCFFDNMDVINSLGFSVFLDVSPEVIKTRLINTELEKRPLFKGLTNAQITENLQALLDKRLPFYEKAK